MVLGRGVTGEGKRGFVGGGIVEGKRGRGEEGC